MAKKHEKSRKKRKKSSFFLLFLLIILLGGGIGGFYLNNYISRNDMFEVNGDKVIYLEIGDEYVEQNASAIAFGKKVGEKDIKIEGEVDITTAGRYTIKYTTNNFKYKNVARYRIVIVSEPEIEQEPDIPAEESKTAKSENGAIRFYSQAALNQTCIARAGGAR